MKKILPFVFVMVFFLNLVSAQPPQVNFGDLNIEHNSFDAFPVNTDHNFSFYVSNTTALIPDANCYFNLDYNNGISLYRLTDISGSIYPNEYYVYANSTNFTSLGQHSVVFFCNTTSQSGGISFTFDVTPTGSLQSTAQGLGSISFLLIMIFLTFVFGTLGFRFIESEYLWALGFFFIFLAIAMFEYIAWLGVEYSTLYIGFGNNSGIPEIIFLCLSTIVIISLAIAGLLSMKKIPSWVKSIFPFLPSEDGWDKNVFDKY